MNSSPSRAVDDLLVLDQVYKSYTVSGKMLGTRLQLRAVDGVSLRVRRGKSIGIVGESGSGKSTLARIMLGLTTPDRGRVIFDGVDLRRASRSVIKQCRRSLQVVFQDPVGALDPRMRIGTSMSLPLIDHTAMSATERRNRVAELLELVGLEPHFASRFPSQCSGGELQRIVIARALGLDPKLLVCDEPTAALDASNRAQILNVLGGLRERLGLSLVMISHDLRVVERMCDEVHVMYLGGIVEQASAGELFRKPRHPYSRQLMEASRPSRELLSSVPEGLDTEPPSPIDPPNGCHFHPRCPFAQDRCLVEAPTLSAVLDGQKVACHFWYRVDAEPA